MAGNITESNKQETLDRIIKKQEQLYTRGKIMVYIIIGFGIISNIISFVFLGFNIVSLISSIVLYVALYIGKPWARYYLAIVTGLSVLVALYALLISIQEVEVISLFRMSLFGIHTVGCIICSALLFCSKSIKEFVYIQENG